RDEVHSVQLKLEAAKAAVPKENAADPTKAMTVVEIAAEDSSMAKLVEGLDQLNLRMAQLKRTIGPNQRMYQDCVADIDLQQQRINTYAESYRRAHSGIKLLNTQNGTVLPLSNELLRKYELQVEAYKKKLKKEEDENRVLSAEWS